LHHIYRYLGYDEGNGISNGKRFIFVTIKQQRFTLSKRHFDHSDYQIKLSINSWCVKSIFENFKYESKNYSKIKVFLPEVVLLKIDFYCPIYDFGTKKSFQDIPT
jgi:hypothetical protein